MSKIYSYHAHVYFNQETMEQASALCEAAKDRFSINMGRMHTKPIGPHPVWSCQLAFPAKKFGDIIPWLTLNRDGLTIFIHTETGDEWLDHTKYTMWMGQILPLNLDALKKS